MLEPLRIELSVVDLGLLSRHVGLRAPGGEEQTLSGDQQTLAAESLQRRGLLNVLPGGGVQLDDLVAALLGTCAYPSFSIVVHQATPRESGQWSIRYAAELGVEQRKLTDERYVFTAYSSARQVLDRLASALAVGDQPRPAGELIALERTVLETARAAAATGTLPDIAEALQREAVPAESSRCVAQLPESFEEIAQLTAYHYPHVGGEPLVLREILLLRGPGGFWVFVGPVEDSDELYAAPMSGAEVDMLLTTLLNLGTVV